MRVRIQLTMLQCAGSIWRTVWFYFCEHFFKFYSSSGRKFVKCHMKSFHGLCVRMYTLKSRMVNKFRVNLGCFCSPRFLAKHTENRFVGALSESEVNNSPKLSVTYCLCLTWSQYWSATRNRSTCQRPWSTWFELFLILSPENWSWNTSFIYSLTETVFGGETLFIAVPLQASLTYHEGRGGHCLTSW